MFPSGSAPQWCRRLNDSPADALPRPRPTNRLQGVITRTQLETASHHDRGQSTVTELGHAQVVVAPADETLRTVAVRMAEHAVDRMPVVDRHDPDQVVGLVTPSPCCSPDDCATCKKPATANASSTCASCDRTAPLTDPLPETSSARIAERPTGHRDERVAAHQLREPRR